MPLAEVAGRELFYTRRGRGEPLLLIMGMAGHHRLWGEPFVELLAAEHDVIAYDHRGIGDSGRVDELFTIAELAEDAARLLDALGVDSAHVVGISMGGMVAQELTLRHPGRVRTLVLGCTYAGPGGGSLDSPGVRRMAGAWRDGDREVALRAGFDANVSAVFAAGVGRYDLFRTATLAAKVPLPVVMMQLNAVVAHDAAERLRTVTTPTLVVHGTVDEMLPHLNGEHIASLIPGATLATMDGVGHLFFWEQPERSAELVLEHTRSHSRSEAAEAD